MEGLGYLKASLNTLVPVLCVLPLRAYFHKRTGKKLRDPALAMVSPHGLPWKEFSADMVAWLLVGSLMAAFYLFYLHAPLPTIAKILLGCASFGLFGGMLSFLSTEGQVIERLKEFSGGVPFSPKGFLSVTKKMFILTITVQLFIVTVIVLMVFMDIHYLLLHRDAYGPEVYMGVFKEILFAFAVLLSLSLLILKRYSANLKGLLANQLNVMERIGKGEYDLRVPVVSNDEFGLIAAKTNDMIEGLREKDLCQISFGKYVTPEVSEKILRGEVSAEGELCEVTILFCDLRGYTPFVERKEPKEVVAFLNEYFSEMEGAVREHNGIVLQYIGDEIEAVFGAPNPEPDHPTQAVLAALEMRGRLKDLNRRRISAGEGPVEHGIGIHTGTVLAGNVGSAERLVYAMVGDAVNVASRIQTLNKQFGSDILLSEATKERLKPGLFEPQSLGYASIKGKSREMEIYSIP